MQCIITEKQFKKIKLTHYDETKNGTHDLQIARAKETLKRQAPTNGLTLYIRAVI